LTEDLEKSISREGTRGREKLVKEARRIATQKGEKFVWSSRVASKKEVGWEKKKKRKLEGMSTSSIGGVWAKNRGRPLRRGKKRALGTGSWD